MFEKHVFDKKCVSPELFPLFKGLGRAHMGPKKKIRQTIALISAFKGPYTLP